MKQFKSTSLLIVAMISLLLVGCSDTTDIIEEHAELALEQCGKGNVKSVNVDGFSCFEKRQD